MALPQQKFREIVFQLLYSYDLGRSREEDMIPLIMKELSVTRKSVREAHVRVEAILAERNKIDEVISKTSHSYAFERIQSVEKNILRLGVFELIYAKETPPVVAISEAVRLARKFGSPESATFVNAVLDGIYKLSEGVKIDSEAIAKSAVMLAASEEAARTAILEGLVDNSSDEECDE